MHSQAVPFPHNEVSLHGQESVVEESVLVEVSIAALVAVGLALVVELVYGSELVICVDVSGDVDEVDDVVFTAMDEKSHNIQTTFTNTLISVKFVYLLKFNWIKFVQYVLVHDICPLG